MTVVPVLLYHSVSDDPPEWIAPLTISPGTFTRQLDRIADAGVTVVSLRRLVSAIRGGAPLPSRSAVLTFDEGFSDFYWTVVPQLQARELPATLFVTTGAIHPPGGPPTGSLLGPADMLNWRQIAGLDALGVEIGGHSRTHAELDTLDAGALQDELVLSKRDLEEALGHAVTSFAYPHGYSSPSVRHQVLRAGWDCACGTAAAFSSTSDDTLRLARLTVRADTPATTFRDWLERRGAPTAPIAESWTDLGWRAYRRLRARLGLPPAR